MYNYTSQKCCSLTLFKYKTFFVLLVCLFCFFFCFVYYFDRFILYKIPKLTQFPTLLDGTRYFYMDTKTTKFHFAFWRNIAEESVNPLFKTLKPLYNKVSIRIDCHLFQFLYDINLSVVIHVISTCAYVFWRLTVVSWYIWLFQKRGCGKLALYVNLWQTGHFFVIAREYIC